MANRSIRSCLLKLPKIQNSVVRPMSVLSAREIKLVYADTNSRLIDPLKTWACRTTGLNVIQKRFDHKPTLTYDFIRDRVMFVCRLFDKIDGEKLTLESNFFTDCGLDSLDHLDVIYQMEDEFSFEIPPRDAEKLIRPIDIVNYIRDREECYPELEEHH